MPDSSPRRDTSQTPHPSLADALKASLRRASEKRGDSMTDRRDLTSPAGDASQTTPPVEPELCPGGCGCRLGTEDADRFECGCDEGCCDDPAAGRDTAGGEQA